MALAPVPLVAIPSRTASLDGPTGASASVVNAAHPNLQANQQRGYRQNECHELSCLDVAHDDCLHHDGLLDRCRVADGRRA
jgi:hypothetical protein